jgi:RHS repeat-associated protein
LPVLDQIAYDAFGNIVAQLNPLLVNPILFTSREFDAETGLYYNRARYLDPTTGRWTIQDPLGFAAGDANLYRYVGNTPTLLVDPSGNLAWFVAVPLVMGVAGFTWLTGSTALVSYRTTGSWSDASTWATLWDGLRLGIQANVNGLASAARSLLTLGVWNEPWEVWAVDEVDRPYYNDAFLAARFGWELLPTAGIARLTQIPGQIGRWGRWALGWDAGQNAVQASRGGYDIYENGLTGRMACKSSAACWVWAATTPPGDGCLRGVRKQPVCLGWQVWVCPTLRCWILSGGTSQQLTGQSAST